LAVQLEQEFHIPLFVKAQSFRRNLFSTRHVGASGHPDPNWDFEPDTLTVRKGTTISAVDQGGEPHTLTEVAKFGGGFIPELNAPGEEVVPECSGGFSKVSGARTPILQGSQLQVAGCRKVNIFSVLHPSVDAHESRGEMTDHRTEPR